MWLLIDDERSFNVDVIARTAEAGMMLLGNHHWNCVMMDHDLGSETTGYDLIMWALKEARLPKKVQLVTMNSVGRDRMKAALLSARYVQNGPNFILE